MPADSSHNAQTRRASRKHTHDDEIDVRRARGEISCAECRRLKLKCDKKLPCSSCSEQQKQFDCLQNFKPGHLIRRGCPSICPNGSLSTGQGTRFVLADTSQLHAKITEMGQRIRQLEDALAISQSSVSNEPHPLLRDELLTIKFGPENGTIQQTQRSRDPSMDSIDALGTLTIGDRGEAKYFGRSAGSETLLLAGAEMELTYPDDDEPPTVNGEVIRMSSLFPFCYDGNCDRALDIIYSHLPEQPRAWSLCETYLEQASWQFRPIRREELIDEILTPIYRLLKERQSSSVDQPHTVSAHRVAALCIIFALGALVDLTLEPFNAEAEKWFTLCRAALSLRSVFDSPEVCTVQTVVLIASYQAMAGKRYTMDSAWSVMSLGGKLAQSIGLHRDSARWNLDPKTVNRRRSLFYEIFSSDIFHSLSLGRPPAIRMSYVDCEFPSDYDVQIDEQGQPMIGFYQWKYEFCTEIFAQVLELTLTAESPNYQTILDLDRKVREKTLPPHLNVFMNAEDEHCTPDAYMRGCILGQYRSITFLHKQCLTILSIHLEALMLPHSWQHIDARQGWWAVWNHRESTLIKQWLPKVLKRYFVYFVVFSAAIIVGSIVTRSPSSTMAPNAFIELGLACDLFERGARKSRRARSALAILCKLRDKAFQVYSQYRSGNPPIPSTLSVGRDYGDDELALFGGQTRVLFSKLLSERKNTRKDPNSRSSPLSPSSTESPSGSEDQNQSVSESLPDVHPSLVEYISLLPPAHHPQSRPSPPSISGYVDQNYIQPILSGFFNSGQVDHEVQNMSMFPNSISTSSSSSNGQDIGFLGQLQDPTLSAFSTEPLAMNGNAVSSPENLLDLGMMMSSEAGIDEQWRSFMRESGLLDHSTTGLNL